MLAAEFAEVEIVVFGKQIANGAPKVPQEALGDFPAIYIVFLSKRSLGAPGKGFSRFG